MVAVSTELCAVSPEQGDDAGRHSETRLWSQLRLTTVVTATVTWQQWALLSPYCAPGAEYPPLLGCDLKCIPLLSGDIMIELNSRPP